MDKLSMVCRYLGEPFTEFYHAVKAGEVDIETLGLITADLRLVLNDLDEAMTKLIESRKFTLPATTAEPDKTEEADG